MRLLAVLISYFAVSTVLSFTAQLPALVVQQTVIWRSVLRGEALDPIALMEQSTWITVPTQFVSAVLGLLAFFYLCHCLALMYFDLRARIEGEDLKRLVERLRLQRSGEVLS